MSEVPESLAPETLKRLSQATQMSLYLIQVNDRLSQVAVAWAKQMFWLQEPWMTDGAARYGGGLQGRTQEVSEIQAEVSKILHALRNRLAAMLDIAIARGNPPLHLLDALGAAVDATPKAATKHKINERPAPGLADVRYMQMPFDRAIGEMTEEVLETCVQLQRQNAALEAAMRRLPELRYA